VDGLWKFGEGAGPEIKGTQADLAWWLIGRGDGSGLVSSTGELPRLTKWR
jgi:maleylpyruvate isomerase